ncbi:MAG: two-component regulator propeller domain-containing protein [Bacteroidota bacterium]
MEASLLNDFERMRRFALFVLLLWLAVPAWAQDMPSDDPVALGRWQSLTAFNEVRALAASPTTIWAATSGGVFGYTPTSGEIERYTTVEGLASISPTTIAYDAQTAVLWVGHSDGALDRLDPATGLVQSFFDIQRTDRFTARQVERLRVGAGVVYAATGFGIVVFDTERLEVRDSYTRLGPVEAGTTVRDVLEAPLPDGTPGLWAATAEGIVRASQAANLLEPGAWTLDPNGPADAGVLAFFQGAIVAGTTADVLRRGPDDAWSRLFLAGSAVAGLLVDGGRLVGVDPFSVVVYEPGQPNLRFFIRGEADGFADIVSALALSPDGQLWAGDLRDGLMRLPALGTTSGDLFPEQIVVPEGPRSNRIDDLDAGRDGSVWLAPRRSNNRTTVARRDEDGTWQIYTEADGLPPSSMLSALADPDGGFWGGSTSDGLVRIDPDGVISVFDTENSTILSGLSNPDFVPIVDAALDREGQIWALNQATAQPLHVRDAEASWTGLPFPSNVTGQGLVQGVLIDRFDQKWVFTTEAGIFVYGPGSDVPQGSAPFIRPGGTNGIGLPNGQVQALAEDLDGRIWVGTRRGLATIFSPGSAFSGDASLIEPQWARTEDGTSFFLRDLLINDIAVDPANNKWLASSSGAWLIDSDGENVLQRFTAADSPLFSDNVIAVDVDAETGVVYFATERGVLSYQAEAVAAAPTLRDLDVAPNPYRPAQHAEGVLITGLLAETRVRILTVDGRLVRTLDTRGGAVRWDGRDTDGQTVPSGVYLVAATGLGDEGTGFGKIAVIR